MQIVEYLIIGLVVLFIITQTVIPPWIGKPLFWIFRSGRGKKETLTKIIDEVEVAKEIVNMSKRVHDLVDEVDELVIPQNKKRKRRRKSTRPKKYIPTVND